MEVLKCNRAWYERVFRGDCKSASELRQLSTSISDETILYDNTTKRQPHWYATFCVDDQVELPEDPEQELLGVQTEAWVGLDQCAFFDKHTATLDQLAVQTSILIAPHRYRWLVCNAPIVHLPTGIALRPLQVRGGRIRAFGAPSFEAINLPSLSAGPTPLLKNIPMVLHFYLRSMTETDPISRFFDAFRGLEVLCQSLRLNLHPKATSNCAAVTVSAPKAIQKFQEKTNGVRKSFATMALAVNPMGAEADLGIFCSLSEWRNKLAHGKGKLQPDDAPDEEAFELLHKYIAKAT
jgi:hypothetical protein